LGGEVFGWWSNEVVCVCCCARELIFNALTGGMNEKETPDCERFFYGQFFGVSFILFIF
jgi:hypothetical protein